MMVVVTGASGSGKSEYAEGVAVKLAGKGDLYYLATMRVYGEEGVRRVERHRKLRAGKGFQTAECPVKVDEAFAQVCMSESFKCLIWRTIFSTQFAFISSPTVSGNISFATRFDMHSTKAGNRQRH